MYIDHYAGTPAYGMDRRCFQLAEKWRDRGHRVVLVGASYSHLRHANPRTGKAMATECHQGIETVWLRTPKYTGSGAARVANMSSFALHLRLRARQLAAHFAPEIVIGYSPHPWVSYGADRIARHRGAPWVFEIGDIWPMTITEIGKAKHSHPLVRSMQAAEDFALRRSAGVASPLRRADVHCRERGWNGNFCWVPNGWSDPAIWDPPFPPLSPTHQSALATARRDGRFTVGYSGTVGPANNLQLLLDAAAELKDEPFAFLILGSGPELGALSSQCARRGLGNVRWLPRIPLAQVPNFLSQIDSAYLGVVPSHLYDYGTSQNKLVDYLMAGLPVVAALPQERNIISEARCGQVSPPGDVPALTASLRRLAETGAEERRAMGRRGLEYARGHLDLNVLGDRYLQFLTQIATQRCRRRADA